MQAQIQFWHELSETEKQSLLTRPAQQVSQAIAQQVEKIIQQVQTEGDQALRELTARFDGAQLDQIRLSTAQQRQAMTSLEPATQQAIDQAYANIRTFHVAQLPQDIQLETLPGVVCQQKHAALEAVGLYIPGGSAPLPSTVLMLGVCAQVAGCPRKIVCTPPNAQGQIADEIIYAACLCGIDEIYLVGGAQAIAAMALGTKSIAKVDKIFGPGNAYVTQAKQSLSQMSGGVAIDMPAGPSEVLVIADQHANPAFVAADLLSQAEHGADSQAILVSHDLKLVEACIEQVAIQLTALSRSDIASQSMQHARYIVTEDLQQSIAVSNQYAPEHLIVQVENAGQWLSDIKNAGSVFLGAWSPESVGDYASGTNHVLPTYGYARNYSSLGTLDFMRRYTVQELTKQALERLGNTVMQLAQAEGLDAHRNAVAIRLEEPQ
jgi:histidinol dehydrogenase